MIDALSGFNEQQQKLNKPRFEIGIGINYGLVTVGNIGSERKMDYTVIGDEVNLASRMEGLNKEYRTELLFTGFIRDKLPKPGLPCRLLDIVAVKGKSEGVRIYTAKKSVAGDEEKAWALHNQGMKLYLPPARDFLKAARYFEEVLKLFPKDFNAADILERCKTYIANPPAPDWNGVKVMKTK